MPPAGDDEPGVRGRVDDPAALQGLRVLVVEDNPVNMMITVAVLEQWGVEVEQAIDAPSAIDAVSQAVNRGRPIDMVLMDVQMPGMSGHDAARRLRERFDARILPIVALTAAALVSERDEAFAAGMNEFLTKPVDTERLREALLRCAEMRSGALVD
jgi:CheY-like chemotaxis protein